MNNPLSDVQLKNLFIKQNIDINIVERDEIEYKDILNIKYKPLIILYETDEDLGHWIIIYYNKGYINFFDSYGISPDNQLKYTFYDTNKITNLKNMLKTIYKNKIRYNKFQYQNYNTSTCGYHVFLRFMLRDLSEKKYYDFIFNISKLLNRDMDETIYILSLYL
jgi:hypothetical protein